MEQKKIFFISYRRETGTDVAARVNAFLTAKGYKVFYDITSMKLGFFDDQIYEHIKDSDFFLLLLSKGALDRCTDEHDWVRLEIEYALKNNIQIVPLIFPHFEFPKDLPDSLKRIPYLHGIEYNAVMFDVVMEKIVQMISPHSHDECQILELLEKLYSTTIVYRNALKNGNQEEYNLALNQLVSILQDLYYFGESTRFTNVPLSETALSIVSQFNKFIPPYNAFSNSSDRMSPKAQEYARCAEQEFLLFVDLIQKAIHNLK